MAKTQIDPSKKTEEESKKGLTEIIDKTIFFHQQYY
jgi:hypothetical protein